MIDTVTFDLWNTLMVNAPPDVERYRLKRVENMRRILKSRGNDFAPSQLLKAYLKGFEKCKETWRKNLDLSTEEQLEVMLGFLDPAKQENPIESLMPDLVEAYTSPLLDDPPRLIDGATEVLEQLIETGYKIGLICNTGTTPGSTIRVLLKRFGMMDYFGVATFSNELRIRKPDPRIFLQTLTELRSSAENSLHLGDLLEADVLGAKNVGMVAVLLNSRQTYFEKTSPACDREILPDYSIGELKDLNRVLDELN